MRRCGFGEALAAIILICFLIPASSSGTETSAPQLTNAQRVAIDRTVHEAMATQKIPGLAIEVAVGGRTLYARALGVRSLGKPVDGTTVFPIGSITKQFTAACVVILAEEQRINLDSPVSRYIADAPHAREVTVRQLLDQTSGLPDYSAQSELQAAVGKNKLTHLRPQQLMAMIANKPLKFKPGTKFDYSNTNYVLAGMIVKSASGNDYEDFLKAHILRPLDMSATQYLRTSIAQGDDVARGYKLKSRRQTALPPFTMSWAGAAGALASDTHDLVKWDVAFFGGRVVSPSAVKEMTTPVKSDYGYGWVVERVQGDSMIWHNGELPGAHAMNAFFPRSNMEIIVLTNLPEADPEGLAKRVYAVLRR
jgi:CubicO group peptidase (beta-lactamase class C family)